MNGAPQGEPLRGVAVDPSRPRLVRPKAVIGPQLTFRDATPADGAFILSLRLDPNKNKHLSPTSPDKDAQRRWLEAYAANSSEIYFIVEANGVPVGTVRLYDQRGNSFCWGSWILSDNAPRFSAVESTLMIYHFGMMELGFAGSHFDVRKANTKVWQYHERFGAERVGETDLDYRYTISKAAVLKAFDRYADRLPQPISVIWD